VLRVGRQARLLAGVFMRLPPPSPGTMLPEIEPWGAEKLTDRQKGLPSGQPSRNRSMLSPMTGVMMSSPESA